MLSVLLAAVPATLICAACSSATAPAITPFVADLGVRGAASEVTQDRPSARDRCTRFAKQRIYVGVFYKEGFQNLFSLKTSGRGNVPSLCQITYSGIGETQGLALDANGRLWQSNFNPSNNADSLFVFGVHATGDSAPTQTIAGSNTLLSGQGGGEYQQMGIDASGTVWVPNRNGNGGYITAYANSANGNVAPIATIGLGDNGSSEHLSAPTSVAFDRNGNMFVANFTGPGTIDVFRPPFSDTSTPLVTWTLPGPLEYANALYLSFDLRGDLYVAGQKNIDMYPKGLKSGGSASIQLQVPSAIIFGVSTDEKGRVYVVNQGDFDIDVLPPRPASYNPIRSLRGETWGDNAPETITIGE